MGFFTCMPQWKGDYAKCADIRTLEPGDQIAIWDYGKFIRYQHHGLIWKAGKTIHDIQVCHIWSPYEDRAQSQADSHFRISTLEQFLYKRPLSALRVVEYSASKSRRVLSDLGEVHPYPSDCPEVVLARSKFLLGLGKGEFDIFSQNCEHTAHWCKTGIQYCSQDMTMAAGSMPFKKEMSITQQKCLHVQIKAIQDSIQLEMNRLVALSGKLVYLRQKGPQNDQQYLKVDENNSQVRLVQGSDRATPFRLHCTLKRYDTVHVTLEVESTQKFLCSHRSWRGDRDIQMKKTARKRPTAYTWEYRSAGHLVSERQHRRYCAVNPDKNHRLEESSLRGKATKFVFVQAEGDKEGLEAVPDLPDIYTPETTFQAYAASSHPSGSHPPMPQIQEEDDTKNSVGVEEPLDASS